MPNFTAVPFALSFPAVTVQGSVPALAPNPASTKTVVVSNNSGASVTITNYGFADTTEGDAVTQPAGILPDSDFTVTVSGGFPTTIANGASKTFTVAYAPLRRGSGFGDVRSAILMFYSGNKALSNGGSVFNSSGELLNETLPQLFTIGVGGQVIEEGYDWATVAPIYQGAGDPNQYNAPAGYGNNAPLGLTGMGANMDLADLDTVAHYGPMMFWAIGSEPSANGTNQESTTTPRSATPGTPAYGDVAGTGGTVTTTLIPTVSYDYGTPRGGRSYQLLTFWGSQNTPVELDGGVGLGYDLLVYVNTSSPTLVATFLGVNAFNAKGLFIGNTEGLDLQGIPLVVKAQNFTVNGVAWSSGTYKFNIGAVITG